ncbi:MAG: type II toxin-antitoxin system HicA family toxin, partial [Phycisphaerae bacterium]
MARRGPLKARDVSRLLKRHGFVEHHQKGSHLFATHPDTHRVAVVPARGGRAAGCTSRHPQERGHRRLTCRRRRFRESPRSPVARRPPWQTADQSPAAPRSPPPARPCGTGCAAAPASARP